jgi:ABC-type multidrug transport system fused ATPase/permease subunit
VVSAVSITYPNGHPGVRQASLAAPAGSYLGICGPAGCGKSTLVKALVGIVAPQTGTITLGGVEVGQMAASDLADTIAYVSQEPYVISGTVRDNLLLGQPDHLPDLRLAEALDQVGLLAELGGVAGLDAVVGEDGQGLSGGQRQRLVLARILLRQAQVIVLDEATSALDNLNEEQVMHALEASGRTVIAIAHRLSTLRRADQIVVMRDGQIVERGTYPTLDAAGGLFHSLLHAGETDLPPDGTTVSPRVGVSRRNCAEPAIPEWVGHSRPAHPLST